MEIKEAKAIILAGLAGANWTTEQKEAMKTAIQSMDKIETYKKEIIELRGKAHLSCPSCYEDCQSWIVEGKPCRHDW